ncbi:ankyrin repeat and SOCS box protein 10, partial [Biomphalaria glabrata]
MNLGTVLSLVLWLVSFLATICFLPLAHCAMVTTSKGPVRGTTQYVDGKKKVDVFLGIPYAKPPI